MGIKTICAFAVGTAVGVAGNLMYENFIKKDGIDVKIKDSFKRWVKKDKKEDEESEE